MEAVNWDPKSGPYDQPLFLYVLVYFESGRSGALAGQINLIQGSEAGDRRYNIKVSYIPCNSKVR